MRAYFCLCVLVASAACSKKTPAPKPEPVVVAKPVDGVRPREFKCDSLISTAELSTLLGASVTPVDTTIKAPPGVPTPCNYLRAPLPTANAEPPTDPAPGNAPATPGTAPVPPSQTAWTWDIDCRANARQTFETLYADYQATNIAAVADYENLLAQHGGKPPNIPDAAPLVRPAEATAVSVGEKGLDHHGLAIVFFDDDTPCYLRVIGPEAPRRLALAKQLASRLTPKTAPTLP